ncbi:hypothetical protein OSB04_001799 [Centaurea solstitialis]|uniref:Uncharacterized protein n=1 Tax=Centaurea solstitialis TaxID=347529 RepID=A0AA38TZ86_9ASTR|nr:hypothetical protein OSB04_001799 [Centaurea solstitialis]
MEYHMVNVVDMKCGYMKKENKRKKEERETQRNKRDKRGEWDGVGYLSRVVEAKGNGGCWKPKTPQWCVDGPDQANGQPKANGLPITDGVGSHRQSDLVPTWVIVFGSKSRLLLRFHMLWSSDSLRQCKVESQTRSGFRRGEGCNEFRGRGSRFQMMFLRCFRSGVWLVEECGLSPAIGSFSDQGSGSFSVEVGLKGRDFGRRLGEASSVCGCRCSHCWVVGVKVRKNSLLDFMSKFLTGLEYGLGSDLNTLKYCASLGVGCRGGMVSTARGLGIMVEERQSIGLRCGVRTCIQNEIWSRFGSRCQNAFCDEKLMFHNAGQLFRRRKLMTSDISREKVICKAKIRLFLPSLRNLNLIFVSISETMAESVKDMTSKFPKLEKFQEVDF